MDQFPRAPRENISVRIGRETTYRIFVFTMFLKSFLSTFLLRDGHYMQNTLGKKWVSTKMTTNCMLLLFGIASPVCTYRFFPAGA